MLSWKLSRYQTLFVTLLVAIWLFDLLRMSWYASQPGIYEHGVGDWLINYGGGFVRRGLAGTILIYLSSLVRCRPELTVFVVRSICYLVIYGGVIWVLFKAKNFPFLLGLCLLSPACMYFPVQEAMALGRKEILIFLVSILAFLHSEKHDRPILVLPWFFSLLLLVHEGLLFFFPLVLLVFLLVYKEEWNWKEMVKVCFPSLFILLISMRSINVAQVHSMIKSFAPNEVMPWFKSTVFSCLNLTIWDWSSKVVSFISWKILVEIPIICCLVSLPLLSVPRIFWASNKGKLTIRLLIATLLLQIPFFLITLDWGRWIATDCTLLTFAIMGLRIQSVRKINWLPFLILVAIYHEAWMLQGTTLGIILRTHFHKFF